MATRGNEAYGSVTPVYTSTQALISHSLESFRATHARGNDFFPLPPSNRQSTARTREITFREGANPALGFYAPHECLSREIVPSAG